MLINGRKENHQKFPLQADIQKVIYLLLVLAIQEVTVIYFLIIEMHVSLLVIKYIYIYIQNHPSGLM